MSNNGFPPGTVPRLGFDWGEPPTSPSPPHENFIRSVDWSATSVGPPSKWPAQLKESVDFVLGDPTPAAVMWGDDLTMIYNEGFAEFAGSKHPQLMGKSPKTEYAEVWPVFEDIIHRGRTTGQATRHKDVQLFLNRASSGWLEETFVTYTFIPIIGPDRQVAGFYHTAMETTSAVLSARRTQTLLALGDNLTVSRSLQDYWDNLLKALEENNQDMHWVLAYSMNDGENATGSGTHSSAGTSSPTRTPRGCTLAGATTKAMGKVPLSFDRQDDQDAFTQIIKRSVRSGKTELLQNTDLELPEWIFELGAESHGEQECRSALLIPIRPTTKNEADGGTVIGFLLVGVAATRGYDKDLAQFVQLFSRQLDTSAASIMLLEQEIRRQQQLTEQLSTSTKQAQELEKKFSRFAEVSNIGMWIASPSGELLYANKTWYEQAGLPFNSPGMNVEKWMPLITEASLAEFAGKWDILMKSHQPITLECEFKARWHSRDPVTGQRLEGAKWFLISAFPEFADDGSLKSAWGCNVELSYQKWAQNLKDERLHEIMEAKRQTENFIDMTSHEMRNPLSAILQSADAISSVVEEVSEKKPHGVKIEIDQASADSIADYASTIMACAQHQKRIVDDILTLSKLDASLLVVSPDEVDPVATVKHALQLHQQELKTAGVEGSINIEKSYRDLHIGRVFLDPSRLLQVLINLLTNAIKFILGSFEYTRFVRSKDSELSILNTQYQPERRVTLHLGASVLAPSRGKNDSQWFAPRTEGKFPGLSAEWGAGDELYLIFSIEDTGCGLSGDEMQKLFTRFSQASPKTHVQYGGSGLGLFICKELTELQGGRIGVTSISGKGSTFKFFIKVRRAIPTDKAIEEAIEENARKLEKVVTIEAEQSDHETSKAVEELKNPNYVHPVNKGNEGFSNPVVGSPQDANTLHVLIVEDNLINQKVMANQLRKASCIVHVADHGVDALTFLKKTTFAKDCGPSAIPLSIVLMDLEMPVMDGLTCVRKIREMQADGNFTRPVPVIAVTANARLEQVKNAKDMGMDDVVTKPFRIKDLIPQMYNLIKKVSV